MNPIDIRELAADCDRLIGGLPDHTTRGPLLVTRDGEPEAVIIRHAAYAPRLHDFAIVQGGILCWRCPMPETIHCDTSSLGVVLDAANLHWRETHRKAK